MDQGGRSLWSISCGHSLGLRPGTARLLSLRPIAAARQAGIQPSSARGSLKRFFRHSSADIHGLWNVAKNSTAGHRTKSARFEAVNSPLRVLRTNAIFSCFHSSFSSACGTLFEAGRIGYIYLRKCHTGAQHPLKKSKSTSSS